ncbi:MAG: redoxin domain-containing protein, partial [Proteobacteria bacterium]|nr:redoxin domain-containing protein [Pseudomonadota bacterium]
MSVLVGRKAPNFTCAAVLGDGSIVDDFKFLEDTKGKHRLVFFYPLDFTFVCPSELIALDHRMDEFKKRGVEVVGVSIDSQFTHNAWRNTPIEKGGIGPVKYTLAADVTHQIARDFGVELRLEDVLARPTLQGLSRYIGERAEMEAAPTEASRLRPLADTRYWRGAQIFHEQTTARRFGRPCGTEV